MLSRQKTMGIFFLLHLMINIMPMQAMQERAINDMTIALSIPIILTTGQYLYVDHINVSANNPGVKLSEIKSSVEPIMWYDTTLKEKRRVIDRSTTLTCTASITKEAAPYDTLIRLIYYTNDSASPHEKIFPLTSTPIQKPQHTTQEQNVQPPIDKDTSSIAHQSPQTSTQVNPLRLGLIDQLKASVATGDTFWIRLLMAFILGLLMSLTPCIYPMIPITIGILQTNTARSPWRHFAIVLTYTAGIATTFSLLGLFAALAGNAFGSLMNHPIVIILVVGLLIYSALSLFGLYEMYTPRFKQRNNKTDQGSFLAVYLAGAISGTVASPCLSPGLLFMLSLVAKLQNIWMGFLLLFAFAIGLSMPLLIIGTFSQLLSILPKAGYWMIEIKHFLGFLLLGMCFYFLASIIPPAILLSIFSIFLLSVGLFYLFRAQKIAGTIGRTTTAILGMFLVAFSVFWAIRALQHYYDVAPTSHSSTWFTTIDDAHKAALQQEKNLFVFVHGPLCTACNELMDRFTHEPSARNALKNVVFLILNIKDTGSRTYQVINTKHTLLGAPICLLFNASTMQLLNLWEGELTQEQYIDMLHTISNAAS